MLRLGGTCRVKMLTAGLLVLLPLVAGSWPVAAPPTLYQRTAGNTRCGAAFRAAAVPSLAACAAVCSRESGCVGFSLEASGGPQRACEMTRTTFNCVSHPRFNFYLTLTLATSTTAPANATVTTSTTAEPVTSQPQANPEFTTITGPTITASSKSTATTSVLPTTVEFTTEGSSELGTTSTTSVTATTYVPTPSGTSGPGTTSESAVVTTTTTLATSIQSATPATSVHTTAATSTTTQTSAPTTSTTQTSAPTTTQTPAPTTTTAKAFTSVTSSTTKGTQAPTSTTSSTTTTTQTSATTTNQTPTATTATTTQASAPTASTTTTTQTPTTTTSVLYNMVACGGPSDLDQAVVGITTLSNKKNLQELRVRDLALTGSQMEQIGTECDSGSVVIYSTCDVSSYMCREAVSGMLAGGCQDLDLDKQSKSAFCQTNMAVVKITKDGSKVDGITCCPVVGW